MASASVVFLFSYAFYGVLGLSWMSAPSTVIGPAPSAWFNAHGKSCESLRDWATTQDAAKYAARPDEAQWQARLEDAVRRGSQDPCSATIQATMGLVFSKVTQETLGPKKGSGFGSRMNNFINEFAVAIVGGFPIALSMIPGDGMLNEVWPKDFVNVAKVSFCTPIKNVKTNHECPHLVGTRMAEQLNTIDPAYIEKLKRFIVPLVYTYTADTQARLDAALASWLPPGGAPFVGVHIRHGDKFTEHLPQPTQLYGQKIKEFDGASPRPVFLATDDLEAKSTLQAELGSGYAAISQQPLLPDEAYTTREYDDEASVFAVMADIEALRRADLFIGTASSNMGRLIWFIRDPSLESLSLDFDNKWMVLGGLQTRRPGMQ